MKRSIPQRPSVSRLLMLFGVMLTCAASPVSWGQDADNGNEQNDWYQVELIVFAQNGGDDTGEVWRTDIDLDYPAEWLKPFTPEQLREWTNRETTLRGASLTEGSATTADTSFAEVWSGADAESALKDPERALQKRVLLLLPEEDMTLTDQARRLNRSGQHRVLFHGAWRQPLREGRQEPSVLISGGDQFDNHHELEGSIHLYRRTYLHIETDLWLARFAANYGQERRSWPKLPWPPYKPREAVDIDRIDDGGSGLWHQLNKGQDDPYAAILAQPYVVESIVHMDQGRRMRSKELHYVDHPHMGLLVKVTPYEPPEENSRTEVSSGDQAAPGS